MYSQVFNLIKYDLNGHWRSQNVTFMFILTLTFVLMDNYLSFFIKFMVFDRILTFLSAGEQYTL